MLMTSLWKGSILYGSGNAAIDSQSDSILAHLKLQAAKLLGINMISSAGVDAKSCSSWCEQAFSPVFMRNLNENCQLTRLWIKKSVNLVEKSTLQTSWVRLARASFNFKFKTDLSTSKCWRQNVTERLLCVQRGHNCFFFLSFFHAPLLFPQFKYYWDMQLKYIIISSLCLYRMHFE